MPNQLHLIGQVVLLNQASQVEIPTGRDARSGEPRRGRRRPRLEEEDVAGFVGFDHGADRRRLVVDDGNRPVAGSGESAQSLDLGGDDITWVAGLVHVEKVAVELDPQVSPEGVQRAQRVDPHPLGATRVEPNEGGAVELKPTDHLEHARIGTLTSRALAPATKVAPDTNPGRPAGPSPQGLDG